MKYAECIFIYFTTCQNSKSNILHYLFSYAQNHRTHLV